MSTLNRELKEQLRVARDKRITVDSVAKNGLRSRKAIKGYRRGYMITTEALEHSYDARISPKN
ncbi:hypothetical protein [Psychroserpens algicola]|uniref:Uncharacterized protein n=1 Tax=Psychroserpens algicola TaxID=1719034 RepID=A0ABT0H3Y8_9FLAO|nr:hypothetical protein [Psychroserpens algicola]MCK8479063.1 hypothetical protein [Psychroserpens algicola]